MHLYGAFFIANWFFLSRWLCVKFCLSTHADWREAIFLEWEKSVSLMPEATQMV